MEREREKGACLFTPFVMCSLWPSPQLCLFLCASRFMQCSFAAMRPFRSAAKTAPFGPSNGLCAHSMDMDL